MADQKLIDEVGKYIDKYYEPVKESSLSEEKFPEEFDVSTMQKTKIQFSVI